MKKEVNLYFTVLRNAIKTSIRYKMDFFATISYPVLFIILRVSIWKALYSSGLNQQIQDINLQNMISYCILSQFISAFVKSDVMLELNRGILNGDICYKLLLPGNIISYEFGVALMGNILNFVYFLIVPFAFAITVYSLEIEANIIQIILFIIATFLAFILHYFYSFIMGISAVWLRNGFFLSNLDEAIFSLFSGVFVPLWFFPKILERLSRFLPFRYMLFEPIAILLGKVTGIDALRIIAIQILFAFGLGWLGCYVWKRAKYHMSIYGG